MFESWHTEPRATLAQNQTLVTRFQPPGPPHEFCGWLLSLVSRAETATSRLQGRIRGWDGLPQSELGDTFEVGAFDLLPGLTRLFVPVPDVELTLVNVGGPGSTVVAQARGVVAGAAESWPECRIVYNRGEFQNVAAGATANYAVPPGATHYRPTWVADLGTFTVIERDVGGAVHATFSMTTTGTADSRRWIPVNVHETAPGPREIALTNPSAGPVLGCVEFAFDLSGQMQ